MKTVEEQVKALVKKAAYVAPWSEECFRVVSNNGASSAVRRYQNRLVRIGTEEHPEFAIEVGVSNVFALNVGGRVPEGEFVLNGIVIPSIRLAWRHVKGVYLWETALTASPDELATFCNEVVPNPEWPEFADRLKSSLRR